MARPSEPLLAKLRAVLKSKGFSTGYVADAARIARPRMRKILAGSVVMTVDELMMISYRLRTGPSDLMCVDVDSDPVPDDVEALHPNGFDASMIDPWSNQPKAVFRIMFELGCDFLFFADTNQLNDSGIPIRVLEPYQSRALPILLLAAHHRYANPRYPGGGIQLALMFDAVYECKFSWSCIKQFVLYPARPDSVQLQAGESPANVPHLRLVT